MGASKGSFQQSDEARAKIAEAAKRQWANPKVRAARTARIKEGWERRRLEGIGVCSACGQPIMPEEGRD
jgi:hypothetical protein